MPEATESPADPETWGCMNCKSQQPYRVEHHDNGNTTWRCAVCNQVVNLIPGKYSAAPGE
jgi:hypothetical protein